MMDSEEDKPIFHDFLGMSSSESPATVPVKTGDNNNNNGNGVNSHAEGEASAEIARQGFVCGTSDLCSEAGVNNSEVFHFGGRKNTFLGLDSSYTFSGRKRSISDSAYPVLIKDKMTPPITDSRDYSRMMKIQSSGKEVMCDRSGRSNEDEMLVSMQLPPRPTSLMLQLPGTTRPDSYVTKWERHVPLHSSQMMHYPSRFGQSGSCTEKLSSSCGSRDVSSSAVLISQAAADEGSRTGIKSSGILKTFNPTGATNDKGSTGISYPNSSTKTTQICEPESSDLPTRRSFAPVGRQMTIFYGGQAHVFDNVHPNKADVIMALAGSTGGSWSTTYSHKSTAHPIITEVGVPRAEEATQDSNKGLYLADNPANLDEFARNPVTGDHPAHTADTHPVPPAELDNPGKMHA